VRTQKSQPLEAVSSPGRGADGIPADDHRQTRKEALNSSVSPSILSNTSIKTGVINL